jgi:cytochrome c peroxidase
MKKYTIHRTTKYLVLACAIVAVSCSLISSESGNDPKAPKMNASAVKASYQLRAPLGLNLESPTFYVPEDNPLTEEKVRLGKRLYFDRNLSVDGTLSCASCHVPEKGFADPNQFSLGVRGQKGNRQAPTIINRAFSRAQFWDGRAASLEEQALGPITNPIEMGNPNIDVVLARLKKETSYLEAFQRAFPNDRAISKENLARAISSFERTIMSGNSPFDRYIEGDRKAMSEAAVRGYQLYLSKANCASCHVSFNFTDETYHNLGVGMIVKKPDVGRYALSKLEGHQGAFKTPTLREIANTAPYMSDGSLKTLEEVVDYYDRGAQPNRWLSPKIKPLGLTAEEKKDLVEFLKALSGEVVWYGKEEDQKRAAAGESAGARPM